MIADMPINTNKSITIQTTHGQIHISKDFIIEPPIPFSGFVKVHDTANDATYWFNANEIVWIGPR